MISLQDRILSHPISDPAYQKQLEADPIFQEVQEARDNLFWVSRAKEDLAIEEAAARHRLDAALAKAKLYESTL